MSGVEIRQMAASGGQRGGRRGHEGGPPLYIGLVGALISFGMHMICFGAKIIIKNVS